MFKTTSNVFETEAKAGQERSVEIHDVSTL
jgi:hypothetical protein